MSVNATRHIELMLVPLLRVVLGLDWAVLSSGTEVNQALYNQAGTIGFDHFDLFMLLCSVCLYPHQSHRNADPA